MIKTKRINNPNYIHAFDFLKCCSQLADSQVKSDESTDIQDTHKCINAVKILPKHFEVDFFCVCVVKCGFHIYVGSNIMKGIKIWLS